MKRYLEWTYIAIVKQLNAAFHLGGVILRLTSEFIHIYMCLPEVELWPAESYLESVQPI